MQGEQESVVPADIAMHVLWHFGDYTLGRDGGMWFERLMLLAQCSDAAHLATLEEAFPVEVSTWRVVAREHWGLEWLRKRVMNAAVAA